MGTQRSDFPLPNPLSFHGEAQSNPPNRQINRNKACVPAASAYALSMEKVFSCHMFDEDPGDSPQSTQELALHGNAEAQFWVGFKLACEDTANSLSQAGQWYQKAAEQGHALAQFNLGV